MNLLDNTNWSRLELKFNTKDLALAFKQQSDLKYHLIESKVRKSLPEFKGHKTKKWSVYIKTDSLKTLIDIKKEWKQGAIELTQDLY